MRPWSTKPLSVLACLACLAAGPAAAQQPDPATDEPAAVPVAPGGTTAIVAVVNGDVISRADVDNRRRLFALSTGIPTSPEVLDRLTPQVTRLLIDEKLRLQEVQRRKIVVGDQEIARAIADVEGRNGLAPGSLRRRLASQGVELRTLIDQLRVQIGWTRVLRQELGAKAEVTDADIAEQERIFKAQAGAPEFRLGEIFVPIDQPTAATEAKRFADTVIEQLRAGAPFPVLAAQFSQSQTALAGGDVGWVQTSTMDPDVARVVLQMPVGAISNPIRVPGGLSIVTLRAKREIGRDPATMLKLRQVVIPFATRLDPAHPTDQQRQALDRAKKLSAGVRGCAAMEAAAKAEAPNPAAPPRETEVRLETATPAMRAVLEKLPSEQASQPLVAEDGIAVVMICGREQRNLGVPSRPELTDRIFNDRVELVSRQLLRDLQRRAVLDRRA